jgi:hypothetical protein
MSDNQVAATIKAQDLIRLKGWVPIRPLAGRYKAERSVFQGYTLSDLRGDDITYSSFIVRMKRTPAPAHGRLEIVLPIFC